MAKAVDAKGVGRMKAVKARQYRGDGDCDPAIEVIAGEGPREEDVEGWDDAKFRTTVLINLASVMERCDEQILPSVYAYIAKSWKASPTELGMLSLARALVQALSSPLGGIAGYMMNRILITSAGCLLWGTMTAAFGLATSVRSGALIWAVNGLGLALVIPSGQSLIADYFSAAGRGAAFGLLYLTSALGGMLGGLVATSMGGQLIWGIEGWRLAFFMVALVSIAIGLLNAFLGKDPLFSSARQRKEVQARITVQRFMKEVLYILRLKTFVIIIAQGVMGSIPWQGMVFFTLWLQLRGLSDSAAAGVYALFLTGTAVGGLLGGWLGDRASLASPDHGRIFVSQVSVAVGLPMAFIIIKGLPAHGAGPAVAAHAVTFMLFGLVKSWAAPACNNPIFSEIVPPQLRNLIYAFDRCFEGALAACAAPLVGLLAERWFGFRGTAEVTGDPARDLPRAHALGNALLLFMVVPWALCFIAYSGLHFTYKYDRQVVRDAPGTPPEDEEQSLNEAAPSHQDPNSDK